ncbi:MAG: hypothetical protein V7K25_25040 [Nostoc sp.]|uniref:hypothetical protein n=1 Tax=Nostoc sp. TaxID=1180 RepID=UPI002FF83F29
MSEKPSFEDFIVELELGNWDKEYLEECLTDEECESIMGGYASSPTRYVDVGITSNNVNLSGNVGSSGSFIGLGYPTSYRR